MACDLIVGDWGTTRLRLFKIHEEQVVDRLSGPGIGQLTASPAATLTSALSPWRKDALIAGVLLCGMAGSRNGLTDVAYAPCPINLRGWARSGSKLTLADVRIAVAAGLSARNFSDRVDVMRGEEAQIFGALTLDPNLRQGRHLVVLPGTHSKWAMLEDGDVLRFHTFPTGEMFALLRDHSTLTRAGTDMAGRDEARWFERLWRRSEQVDEDAIALAESRWHPVPRQSVKLDAARNPRSLLDAILANPGRFRGVGFVLSRGTSTIDHRDATAAALIAEDNARAKRLLSRQERSAIKRWSVSDVFSEWGIADINAWPRRFICAHLGGRGGLTYWFYGRAHTVITDEAEGMVLARKEGALRRSLGLAHGTAAMAAADASRLRALHAHIAEDGHRLLETPEKLAALLTQLDG